MCSVAKLVPYKTLFLKMSSTQYLVGIGALVKKKIVSDLFFSFLQKKNISTYSYTYSIPIIPIRYVKYFFVFFSYVFYE